MSTKLNVRIALERLNHLALIDTTMKPDDPERAEERRFLIALARNPGRFHGFGEKLLERYLAPENIGNADMSNPIEQRWD